MSEVVVGLHADDALGWSDMIRVIGVICGSKDWS